MLKAGIDIGTNSVRLIIADVAENRIINTLVKKVDVVRLGAGVDKNKILLPDSIDRCVNKLLEYKKIIDSYGIIKPSIIATSAVRDAKNKEVFLDKIRNSLGWYVDVVSGEKEASIVFKGVRSSFYKNSLLVFDIGGGSTEFIYNADDKINLFSLDIGCVRMTERFIEKYPVSSIFYNKMKDEIYNQLKSVITKFDITDRTLIGVAGTVTTLASMDLKMLTYDSDKVHKYKLYLKNIKEIHNNLLDKTPDQIKNIPGIHPARCDVILAGSLICMTILELLGTEFINICESELLEGICLCY